MKNCPYCAEEIRDTAIVCRYCGRDLHKSVTPKTPAIVLAAGVGLVIAGLASVLKVVQLLAVSQQVNGGLVSALAMRAALQDMVFHFVVNFAIYSLIAWVGIRVWRISKAMGVAVGILSAGACIVIGGLLTPAFRETIGEVAQSVNVPTEVQIRPTLTPIVPTPHATPTVNWQPEGFINHYDAEEHIGEILWVCGPVTWTEYNPSGPEPRVTLIFGDRWSGSAGPNHPTVRIWTTNFDISDWPHYRNMTICVYGAIYEVKDASIYQRGIVIDVHEPEQILTNCSRDNLLDCSTGRKLERGRPKQILGSKSERRGRGRR